MKLVRFEDERILDVEVELKMTVEEVFLLCALTGMTSNLELGKKLNQFLPLNESYISTMYKAKNKGREVNNDKLHYGLSDVLDEINKIAKGEK